MASQQDQSYNLRNASNLGIYLVASVTKDLSVLPHTLDEIEEEIALCSVISSLAITLDSAILRSNHALSNPPPFVRPLSQDIIVLFSHFAKATKEARDLRVFEPSSTGLVRQPRDVWAQVMGGVAKMALFKKRLYVEKYRLRVLIDAVTWIGLRTISPLERTAQQDQELEPLMKNLPLIAERLVGVWKDYLPRITNAYVAGVTNMPLTMTKESSFDSTKSHIKFEKNEKNAKLSNVRVQVRACNSTETLDSASLLSPPVSAATTRNIHYEGWMLSHHAPVRTLTDVTSIFGISVKKIYKCHPRTSFTKPLHLDQLDIQALIDSHGLSEESVQDQVTKIPGQVVLAIQRLLEGREDASSNANCKTSFKLAALKPHSRPESFLTTTKKRWWNHKNNQVPAQWILVLKGEVTDSRTVNTSKNVSCTSSGTHDHSRASLIRNRQNLAQHRQQYTAPNGQEFKVSVNVNMAAESDGRSSSVMPGLIHVEPRRTICVQEAEKRMEEIFGVLFNTNTKQTTKGETRFDEEAGVDTEHVKA